MNKFDYCAQCVRRRGNAECPFAPKRRGEDCAEFMDEFPMDNSELSFGDALYPNGRTGRKEYAKYVGIVFLLSIVLYLLQVVGIPIPFVGLMLSLYLLAVSLRRLNDIGLGWPVLLAPIALWIATLATEANAPFVSGCLGLSFYAFFLLLAVIKGEKGINRYGSNPTEDYDTQLYGARADGEGEK